MGTDKDEGRVEEGDGNQNELDREAFSQNRFFRGSALLNMWMYTTGEVPIIKGGNQGNRLLEPRTDFMSITLQKS